MTEPTQTEEGKGLATRDAWLPLVERARIALSDQRIFESPIQGRRYRVAGVDQDRIVVERLDAETPEVLTRKGVETAIKEIEQAGGRVARRSQFYTVAKEAALVALHPWLRWDSSGDWIELDATPAIVRPLRLYDDYSRRDVHEIFAPRTAFTPQAGTWGLQGIIEIPERRGDYVVFVTFGQRQGDHVFDEEISEDGVLTWQSQPKESLSDTRIKDLIRHDDEKNSIYLFLRARPRTPYTFLGRLRYLSHDLDRERPVYFRWQLIPEIIPTNVAGRIGLTLQPAAVERPPASSPAMGGLRESPPPDPKRPRGYHTDVFRSRKRGDQAERDARNRELGRAGELLVLRHEVESLRAAGRHDLAALVRHVSELEGDGAGHDIASFTIAGDVKYIEVKTTKGPPESSCYISSNELNFARAHASQYYLYRLYDYDAATDSAEFFSVAGVPSDFFECVPTVFRLMIVAEDN